MFRATIATAAAFALNSQIALASPFNATVSETGKGQKQTEKSAVSVIAERLQLSLAAIGARVSHSSGDKADSGAYAHQQCNKSKTAADEETETHEAKKAAPTGPEPIYFGF